MTNEEMANLPSKAWHPKSEPELSSWLVAEQSEDLKARLHHVGNCVMPDLCRLALNILGNELQSNP